MLAGGGVGRGIFGAEIGFDFDDAACEPHVLPATNQNLAEEAAGNAAGIA